MTVVCLDLDRTTIYSAAALDLRVPDHEAPRLLCVEIYKGAPLSFMTEDAVAAFLELQGVATVVPTTTRTPEQLARVHLPGPPPRYAIASNGGHLLVDSAIDPSWNAAVRARLDACAPLAEVEAHLRARGGPFVLALRTASELFSYAVVDRAALPDGWVEELAAWCAPRGWTVSLQGRKVYAVPAGLTKSAAAAEVVARCGGGPLLAAGDSLLDADLLEAADAAVRPAHGELADTGFRRPHLDVTTASGAAAGSELLRRLRERAAAIAPVPVSGRL
ncbi:HAD family hydrolase [Pseudonocardia nigra]|uniref:HAD family hydrolase n=1 Tax=Pseudonocardia nigra TaxID=1921578 RepID=UPI001C5EDBA3|nr:HAD family hydrolase [Pseudonocardia nigra]